MIKKRLFLMTLSLFSCLFVSQVIAAPRNVETLSESLLGSVLKTDVLVRMGVGQSLLSSEPEAEVEVSQRQRASSDRKRPEKLTGVSFNQMTTKHTTSKRRAITTNHNDILNEISSRYTNN
jgi:hypothetical protein